MLSVQRKPPSPPVLAGAAAPRGSRVAARLCPQPLCSVAAWFTGVPVVTNAFPVFLFPYGSATVWNGTWVFSGRGRGRGLPGPSSLPACPSVLRPQGLHWGLWPSSRPARVRGRVPGVADGMGDRSPKCVRACTGWGRRLSPQML